MLRHNLEEPQKPQRVVVMGAGGFVGGAITKRLAELGIDTLALTRTDVDLLAPDAGHALASLLRPTDCFVAVSARAPVKNVAMLGENMVMLRAMIEALNKVTVNHVVNIGSDAVFIDQAEPLTESSTRAPGSLHGAMHLAREIAFDELTMPVATLRPTLVYGAADPHNGYGPNRFRRLADSRQDIVLFGQGEERRDHVLVDDVAELACRIILKRSQGSLNAATGVVWSFREVASLVANHYADKVAILGSPRSGAMPHNGYRPFDPAATHAAFPDFRYTSLPEGLARVHAQTRS